MVRMAKEVILLLTAEHTGSTFMSKLLSAHKDISDAIGISPFSALVTMNAIETFRRYTLIKTHLYLTKFEETVFVDKRNFKMVTTIRHPYRLLRSNMLANHRRLPHEIIPSTGIMQRLVGMLDVIESFSEVRVLPIDLLAVAPVEYRIKIIELLFHEFLDLDLTRECLSITEAWLPIRIAPPGELTSVELAEFRDVMIEYPVMDRLKAIGVDYTSHTIEWMESDSGQ